MNIKKYYEKNNGKAFLASSLSLLDEQEIITFINNPREFIDFDVDKLNLFLVKIAVAIEFSLKGIAVHKKYNIFRIDSRRLLHYENIIEPSSIKTYELGFFISNLAKLLPEDHQKYKESFEFFQRLRNEFIHFSKNVYRYDNNEIIKHLKFVKEYFNRIVRPLNDECSQGAIE